MTDKKQLITNVTLTGVGKKYNSRWIFRNLDLEINAGDRIAITGANGSGKSTLLQVLSGYVTPSEGTITWNHQRGQQVDIFRHIAFAAPYMDLIDEFTLTENANFFARFKRLAGNMDPAALVAISGLEDASNRQLRYFSSGMKQRARLTFAIMAEAEMLLLDEPLSNLDEAGYEWYRQMIGSLHPTRTVIICSNRVKEETFFCSRHIHIEDYKAVK